MLMVRRFHVEPFLEEGSLGHHRVVVYLISSTNHYVERPGLMAIENIAPEWIGSRESCGARMLLEDTVVGMRVYLLDTHAEAIATMEHDVH